MKKNFLIFFGIMGVFIVIDAFAGAVVSQTPESPDITISVARAVNLRSQVKKNNVSKSVQTQNIKSGDSLVTYRCQRDDCTLHTEFLGNGVFSVFCRDKQESDCGSPTISVAGAGVSGPTTDANNILSNEVAEVIEDEVEEVEEF